MKILLIGEFFRGAFVEIIHDNFIKHGVEVEKINTHDFFKLSLLNRIINKFLKTPHYFGLGVKKLNKIISEKALSEKFDFVFFIKPVFIYPEMIEKIKKNAGCKVVALTLDPPDLFNYNSDYFYKSLPLFDLYFAGRNEDAEWLKRLGAKKVYWFWFGADTTCHYPVSILDNEKNKLGADIVFLGSFSKGERRVKYMEKLCQENYDVKIFGNSWNWYNLGLNSCLRRKEKIIPGGTPCEEMAKVIASSKIVVAFMRDVMDAKIGMRTFEIPLCKGFMLHQRTKEAEELLIPDKEAVFFDTYKELKEKIDFYLKRPELREQIAEAGYRKILNCGLLAGDQIKKIVSILKNEIGNGNMSS